jgi:hypothetical protein
LGVVREGVVWVVRVKRVRGKGSECHGWEIWREVSAMEKEGLTCDSRDV